MRPCVKYPFNCSFPGRGLYISTFSNWWTPSLSHWSYNSVSLALNGLFQHRSGASMCFMHPPGMVTLSTFISFKSSHAVSHMAFIRAPSWKWPVERKGTKNSFYSDGSSSFIQTLPELLTTQRDLNSSSSDLDTLLVARKTTNDFNLIPSALAAKHTLTIHFSCPELSSNKQISLLAYRL